MPRAFSLVFRIRPIIRAKRAIFLFHFGSFVSLAGLLAAIYFAQGTPLTPALAALAERAIYSPSFLELWSLAEGGYTMSLLRTLSDGPVERCEVDPSLPVWAMTNAKRGSSLLLCADSSK